MYVTVGRKYCVLSKDALNIYGTSSLQEDTEDDTTMILDTISQVAISGERLMLTDVYRDRSNTSLPAGLLWVRRCEIY